MTDHDPIREAEAAILRARRGLDYMHQATNADRKLVRDALNEALAALARVPAEPAEEWIERAQAEQDEYKALVASGEIITEPATEEKLSLGFRDVLDLVSAGAGQVPADTIKKALVRLLDEGTEVLAGHVVTAQQEEDVREVAIALAALAAVRTPEGQVPADTIEVARNAIERFVLCSDTRLRDGMSPDQWLAYQGLLAALAALDAQEPKT